MSGLLFANVSSIAATVLILLLRKFFKEKLFAKTFVFLWLLVIIRLLVPFEFYSSISAFAPEKEPVFEEANQPVFIGDLPGGKEFLSEQEEKIPSDVPEKEKAKIQSDKILLSIWISGAVLTGGFFAAKHFYTVKKILKSCVPFDEIPENYKNGKIRFYKSKNLASPLSFGILRPAIIIPENTSENQLPFVLLHEETHVKDRDSVLKILALFALSLNWFNPLNWFMVKMFDRDLERYCDERVLKKLGGEKAFSYANTILDFAERESLSLSFFSAASLCERVTSIMKNKAKKKNFPAVLAVFCAIVFVMTACGTLPKTEEKKPVSAGKLSAEAEELDKILQEMTEKELEERKELISIGENPENVITEMPGLSEELQGYYGENAPNNYATDTYSIRNIEKIEKISVFGFSFAEGSSVTVLLIPSNETKVSITYGDTLRENGLFVEANGNEIIVSVGTACENIEEAFDLRIYGDLEEAEINIENLEYSICTQIPKEETSEGPAEKKDIGITFVSPVKGGFIASRFGSYKGHTGIDIGSEGGIGTDILAVADGTVFKAKRDNTGYGYHIIIDHKNGIQTCYAHCSELLVKQGQKVKAGEVIAKMGATGNSTGIHLHFELRINGEYSDPEEYILFE